MAVVLVPNESPINVTVEETSSNQLTVSSSSPNIISVDEINQSLQVLEQGVNTISVKEVSSGSVNINATSSNLIRIGEGGDLNYVYLQTAPSATWSITHNLGKFPSVSIVDSAGTLYLSDVKYIDENSLTITFNAAFAGKAYLN